MIPLRCATYSRYSTDRQSPTSIEDQIRKCSEFAKRNGWEVLPECCYADRAISAAGSDRPALMQLLRDAQSRECPFQIVLIDDTSRLSRNLADAARIFERLNFAGIRLVAVSQGIDSRSEQADVLVAVHGLVDTLYVKELAKKTHRGLEGRVLRGLHAGGRCFGYRSVTGEDGTRLELDPNEAETVRRIFEMYASGLSLKSIAKSLNAERVPSPRLRAGKQSLGHGWCHTAIREMLRRELYRGRVVWNRAQFVKAPGTNKRVRRARPHGEWRIVERPELCIISENLWQRVRERLEWVKTHYQGTGPTGLLHRSASSHNLLTGFLKCGTCDTSLTIVTGRSGGRYPRYGCPNAFNRGTCTNRLTERRDQLEQRLLSELQREVLKPEVIDYAVSEFERQLTRALQGMAGRTAQMSARKAQLETEIGRLVNAVAEQGHSSFMLSAIAEREAEVRDISEQLLAGGKGSIQQDIQGIRRYVTEQLSNLRSLLYQDVPLAKAELSKHVEHIRMDTDPTGQFYTVSGEWNLLGGFQTFRDPRPSQNARIRMVAGAGFEPATFGL